MSSIDKSKTISLAESIGPSMANQKQIGLSCLQSATQSTVNMDKANAWLASLRQDQNFRVDPIPFKDLNQWSFDEATGNLQHQSGKFFRVFGVQMFLKSDPDQIIWEQPMVEQPEVGLLAFATCIDQGVRKFLVQGKFEPGTINGVQLAPTVQATKSNYSQVHKGAKPPYIDLFMDLEPEQIIYDSLQSEHGCRFYQKRNRNLIVDVHPNIGLRDDFMWLTLREIQALAREKNSLNMPARSVLAAIYYSAEALASMDQSQMSSFGKKVVQSFLETENLKMAIADLKTWIQGLRKKSDLASRVVGLRELKSWSQKEDRIQETTIDVKTSAFSIGAVAIQTKMREVSRWTQPLVWCDRGPWISGMITQMKNGVLHCLVQNIFEPGLVDGSELGPTLSYRQPEMSLHRHHPMNFENYFLEAKPEQIRYDQIQSSEGGRFYHEENRLMIVELEDSISLATGSNYRWVNLAQLKTLLQEPGWVNIELRELMACLCLAETI